MSENAMNGNDIPAHIAIIMDGNGRWAKKRGLSRTQGHMEGVKRVEEIVQAAQESGVKVLTLYTFSTENWSRPRDEVSMLMQTLITVLNKKIEKLNEAGIKLQFIGRRVGIPDVVVKAIEEAQRLTKNNTVMTVNVAFNYGSRLEIIDAVKSIATRVCAGHLAVDAIDEATMSDALYTRGLPDPDLLIRTSGEKRISNFLLWQLSYAEFYFTEKFWPDFTKEELVKAIEDFKNRERRFGNIAAFAKGS